MGFLKKAHVTRPVPADATVSEQDGERIATWTDARGKRRTARVNASGRIVTHSDTWYAVLRCADGRTQTISTKCKDKSAARSVLARLEREHELVRSGVVTASEARVARRSSEPLAVHVADYLEALRRKGTTESHRYERRRYLTVIAERCGFETLRDMDRGPFEDLLAALADEGLSARTRNAYRTSAVAFCNWLLREGRIAINPFNGVPAASERVDRRRIRRAFTNDELRRFLDAAERRPLHDAMHGNRGTEPANLSPDTIAKLQRLGRERRLIYWTLVSTGLRRGELASVRICDCELDGDAPHVRLAAANAKNRREAIVPVPPDVADELGAWIADKRRWTLENTMRNGAPEQLPDDAPLFSVPGEMIRCFDADLVFAGIAKADASGRTLDVHSLRHTLATRLARSGVPLQAAQRVLRHSTPTLTASVYTLLDTGDVAAAVRNAAFHPDGETDKDAQDGRSR